jgi:citryl-CoA lyase
MTEGAPSARYWHTEVSDITPDKMWVRGYDLEELIGLPFSAATFLMIRGRIPTPQETRVMDAVLTAVLDYGLEKSGTAAARYVVSCNPNMQAGIAAATLSAGAYGLATDNTCRFIMGTYDRYLEAGQPDMEDFAREVVAQAKADKFRIPGFGHPVFRFVDPRAALLRKIAQENGLWGPSLDLYEAVHHQFIAQPGREHFPINDVAMMAAITVGLGFTPEESTALAIIGTLPGVVAHISEEMATGRPQRVIPRVDADYVVPRRSLSDDMAAAGWRGQE